MSKELSGKVAVISGGSRGVLISRLDKKRPVVASCPHPESLTLELLRRLVPEESDETEPASV